MALKILDLIDHPYCRLRQQVPDNVSVMVSKVQSGGDKADEIFEWYARQIVTGDQKTRRKGIAMLEKAFRMDLSKLKRYLKERMICNQSD